MHELSITQSVVDTIAEATGGATVLEVRLEIGRLSGVVPDSVRFCFELVCAGTALAGADLDIVEPPGVIRCRDCARVSELPDAFPLCPCGSADVEVVGGRQLKIKSVEVA
ncbi:hydrogenase maturation nickel metallochaperone HypA [Amycolatopsis minnesotensis]|uniref:Hydrogenase maturation factor HypA n=1 Tax=Amycolatopsis minnesotensis TaxID=337894 RepID=A0ABP5C779_9PSEU